MTERLLNKIKIWHILVAAALVYIMSLKGGISPSGDEAWHILRSRAILHDGFIKQFFPVEATTYYIVLATLLLPFSALAPDNFLLMKTIPVMSALVSIVVLNEFLKGIVRDSHRKMVVILFALNPWVVEYSVTILAEMPYILFSIAALLFARRYCENGRTRNILLSLVFLAISLYTRPNALPLISAFFLFFAARKRPREIFFVSVALVFITAPILANLLHFFSVGITEFVVKREYYSAEFRGASGFHILYRTFYNLAVYTGNYLPDIMLRPIVERIDPRLPGGAINLVFIPKFLCGILIAAAALRGFIRTARKKPGLYHMYGFLSVLFLLPMNVYVARRMLSFLPLIILFFLEGAFFEKPEPRVKRQPSHATGRPGDFLFAFLLAVSITGAVGFLIGARTGYIPAEERSFVECNDWVKKNTPEGSIILSRKPSYTELYTARPVVGYMFFKDPEKLFKFVLENKVDYMVFGDLGFSGDAGKVASAMLSGYSKNFQVVYKSTAMPESYVYRFRHR